MDRIIKKSTSFQGKNYNLSLHLHEKYDFVVRVTNDNGKELKGLWKIGTYGQVKEQSLEFDSRSGGNYNMYTTSSWCNGRKKNGRKYLLSIIEL